MFRPKWFGSTSKTFTRPTIKRNNYRPSFELLETRCLLSTFATAVGFDANTLGHVDDDFAGPVDIGFTVNYSTLTFHQVFVNNNGNVTIGAGNGDAQAINFYLTSLKVFGPFIADVDTRTTNTVTYG